jgi:hypothetical protein
VELARRGRTRSGGPAWSAKFVDWGESVTLGGRREPEETAATLHERESHTGHPATVDDCVIARGTVLVYKTLDDWTYPRVNCAAALWALNLPRQTIG